MNLVSLEDCGLLRCYALGGADRTLLNSVTSQKIRILNISAVETSDRLAGVFWLPFSKFLKTKTEKAIF
jgi:hypothetical protein